MTRTQNLDVYIYLRKSRKDIEEERKAAETGQSYDTLDRHRKQLLSLARQRQYNIMEIFEEIVSGEYIADRPMMQKLLRNVEADHIDAVLVMDLDRLGRGDMSDQGEIDRAFRYSATRIITPSEIYDPASDSWELVFGIKSLFAREELKSTTKRLIRGRRQSATEGKHIGKKPPYGYLRDTKLKLYPDPDTAWVVEKIFDRTLNGWGRQRIAKELQRLGIKSPSGNETWGEASIRQMLKNEVYKGTIVWGKHKNIKINGKYVQKQVPKEEWVTIHDAHEPLVPVKTFDQVQEVIERRLNPAVPQSNELKNSLAGLLKCSLCGRTMKYGKSAKRPNAYVHCLNIACKGKQRSAIYSLVEEKILEGLEEIIKEFSIHKDMFEKEKEASSLIHIKEKAIGNKKQELSELQKQKDNLHDLLERGVYDIDTFMERQSKLVERIKKTEQELNLLVDDVINDMAQVRNYTEFLPTIQEVVKTYRSTEDPIKKNRLLKSVLEKATFYRDATHRKQDDFIIKLYLKQ